MKSGKESDQSERKDDVTRRNLQAGLPEEPDKGWRAWAATTGAIVVLLLFLQLLTGTLLVFYYVPSVDHAHVTVTYIEKVVPSGSWVRSIHHHCSQWLALFLLLHILQLFWRGLYRVRPIAWIANVVLLALIMAAGGTGYSLPWDARAFFSTRVAEGIAGGLPLMGEVARTWLLGGSEISTLTLSRFFALHVLVTPALILSLIFGWLVFRNLFSSQSTFASVSGFFASRQFVRNGIAAGIVFAALALYSKRFPAPLGPSAFAASPGYLPRPGTQFLWLYQSLKYVPGQAGSVFAVVLPGLILLGLAALPFLNVKKKALWLSPRVLGTTLLSIVLVLVVTMTTASYVEDRRDPRTRQQLARQAADEAAFRSAPFVPTLIQSDEQQSSSAGAPSSASSGPGPPLAYTKQCATCHGEHGEGARQGPLRFPPLLGVSAKPRRTVDDIIALLNDPKAYGLEPPMKSFAGKLTDEEKRQIAEWVVTLKK
jgi:ubiquinol-cytochrome c reductase cytochrome b subunit